MITPLYTPPMTTAPTTPTPRITVSAIRAQLAECVAAARREGYTGTDVEYDVTRQDMESIIDHFGAKPTRQQWLDAGLGWVGSAHVL